MDTCAACKTMNNAITLDNGRQIYCYDCGLMTPTTPQIADDTELTPDQRAAFDTYVRTREEWEGLRDDIQWGSYHEANAARPQIDDAHRALAIARSYAAQMGVLNAARALFR